MTAAQPTATPRLAPALRTLVVCDLVDSTALVERLGDRESTDLFRQHDRVARALLELHDGREINHTDGFLLLFERPAQALGFALDYQRALRDLAQRSNAPLRARVGIHVGDVLIVEHGAEDVARGAKPLDVEGLVKPLTAQLMSLALPGQILLSGLAHDLALRAERELASAAAGLAFRYHGHYVFEGMPDTLPVYAAGQAGLAPLQRPPSTEHVRRFVPWWRRPGAFAAAVFTVLVLGALAWAALHRTPTIAFAAHDRVVIGNVVNATGATVFDDGLDVAMRIALDQSDHVDVVAQTRIAALLRETGRGVPALRDRELLVDVARRAGARVLLLPRVAESGGSVRVEIDAVDPDSGATLFVERAAGRGAESVLTSVDLVARAVRGRLGEPATALDGTPPLRAVTTADLDALKAYAQARARSAEGDVAAALDLLAFALERDARFAAAHAQRGSVLQDAGRPDEARAALEQALAINGRLTVRAEREVRERLATLGR